MKKRRHVKPHKPVRIQQKLKCKCERDFEKSDELLHTLAIKNLIYTSLTLIIIMGLIIALFIVSNSYRELEAKMDEAIIENNMLKNIVFSPSNVESSFIKK